MFSTPEVADCLFAVGADGCADILRAFLPESGGDDDFLDEARPGVLSARNAGETQQDKAGADGCNSHGFPLAPPGIHADGLYQC